MTTDRPYIYRCSALVFLLVTSESAQSAAFKLIGQEFQSRTWVNGQLVSEQPTAPAQPTQDEPPVTAATSSVAITDCTPPAPPQPPVCRQRGEVHSENDYTIVPESSDELGDSAPMCAVWEAGVEITTSDGAAAAAASGGGTPLSSTSSVPVGATATTSDAAYIQVNGGDKLTMGQLGIPPLMSDSGSFSRDLLTKVGDTISVSTAVAVAAAAPVGGDTEASASGRITLRFGHCSGPPPTSVPTLSGWAIILTSMLLAAVGYFGIGRQSR